MHETLIRHPLKAHTKRTSILYINYPNITWESIRMTKMKKNYCL